MALRKILIEGDQTLRKVSKPVTIFNESLKELLQDMQESMTKADGAGISAVQVGILKRAFVIVDGKEFVWVINPEIIKTSGRNKTTIEGCLSVPEKCGDVERPNIVEARFQNVRGEFVERKFVGFAAKAFCHENDHLNGILFVDKVKKLYNSYDDYYRARDREEQKALKEKKQKHK